MDSPETVAYIQAQTACMLVELEGMRSENQLRERQGSSPAYGEKEFEAMMLRYGVHQNGVMQLLQEAWR